MISKAIQSSLIAALAALILAGCNEPDQIIGPKVKTQQSSLPTPAEVLNIGVFLPLQGSVAPSGQAMLDGMILAAEQANAAGGVLGHPVRLIVRDTKSQPDRVEKAVRDLVTEDKVSCVIGGLSGSGADASAVANELEVPLIVPGSTMPGVQSNEPWTIRFCYSDFLSGRVMARFADSLEAKRAVVLYDPGSDYAKALALAFGKAFKSKRGHSITGEPFQSGTTDFSEHIAEIKKINPDVVYLPADASIAAAILVQARAEGFEIPFLGTATWDCDEFLLEAGEAARNCYLPGRYVPSGESDTGRTFLGNYLSKYKKAPNAMAALGYDSLLLFLEAYKGAQGQAGKPLRSLLQTTTNFEGATGLITVDPVLAVSKAIPVLKVKNGEFSFVETLEP
jgi:branched-chain amino acid transport system substrate-binding protein